MLRAAPGDAGLLSRGVGMLEESGGGTFFGALGAYSDWVTHARSAGGAGWLSEPGRLVRSRDPGEVRAGVLEVLGGPADGEQPGEPRVEERAQSEGLVLERVSWGVGFGPRTEAFLLLPAAVSSPVPGVLALHCHGGFKYYGKEKVADGPAGPAPFVEEVRGRYYGGWAYANALAREGFAVLAHDAFLWGSRRFDLGTTAGSGEDLAGSISAYNAAAGPHEHVVEKYCRLLGTTLAAVVAREDRIALSYLASRPEVDASRLGCVGLSGGGLRAGMLHATSEQLSASVVVAMMTTYGGLLDHNVSSHTWMLYPEGWPARGDWPELVGCRPDVALLVQYARGDELFSSAGMEEAHAVLASCYQRAGNPSGYAGQFYDGPHRFDRAMQQAAFAWLSRNLEQARLAG